jgi:hypothetical protein
LQYTAVGKRRRSTDYSYIDQSIYPAYGGDVIQAVRAPTGFTDPVTNGPIVWQDVNIGGRIWKDTGRRSGCLVSTSGSTSIASNSSTVAVWSTVLYDTDSYVTAPNQAIRFPVPGLYKVECQALLDLSGPTSGSYTTVALSAEYFFGSPAGNPYITGPLLKEDKYFHIHNPSYTPSYIRVSGFLNVSEAAITTNNNFINTVTVGQLNDTTTGSSNITVSSVVMDVQYMGSMDGRQYI